MIQIDFKVDSQIEYMIGKLILVNLSIIIKNSKMAKFEAPGIEESLYTRVWKFRRYLWIFFSARGPQTQKIWYFNMLFACLSFINSKPIIIWKSGHVTAYM